MLPATTTVEQLRRAALEAGAAGVAESSPSAIRCRVPASEVPALADRLAALGARCQFLAAADTRVTGGDFTLAYVFASAQLTPSVTVLVAVPAAAARFASLATRSFAASRFEREIHDLFGLVPEGHPDLRRLALHQYWPEGYHPLRRDAVPRTDFVDAGEPFPFRRVEGEGIPGEPAPRRPSRARADLQPRRRRGHDCQRHRIRLRARPLLPDPRGAPE